MVEGSKVVEELGRDVVAGGAVREEDTARLVFWSHLDWGRRWRKPDAQRVRLRNRGAKRTVE